MPSPARTPTASRSSFTDWTTVPSLSLRAAALVFLGFLAASLASAGCQVKSQDVPAAATRALGRPGAAIAFHSRAERVDIDGDIPATLDTETAVRAVLAHDPRIQSALAKVRAAEADAGQSRLLPNPILGIDVRYPRGSGSNTVFEATISEDLISILEKPAQIAAADNRLRAAAADGPRHRP